MIILPCSVWRALEDSGTTKGRDGVTMNVTHTSSGHPSPNTSGTVAMFRESEPLSSKGKLAATRQHQQAPSVHSVRIEYMQALLLQSQSRDRLSLTSSVPLNLSDLIQQPLGAQS